MHDAGDDDTSWQQDLRIERARLDLFDILSAAAADEIDLPHLVVCTDPETGTVTYQGPFADAMTALVRAEHESIVDRNLNDGPPLVFTVAAIYP